jgi:hypothetical protein
MHEKFLIISKSLLLLSISVLISVFCYLLFFNPELNFVLSEKIARKAEAIKTEETEKLQQWKWFLWSDVNVSNENYPLVVLRSGFKVIKVLNDEALVGWKMDILNTSKMYSYEVEVDYSITDEDRFFIITSTERDWIKPNSFGTIKGTITVNAANLHLLKDYTWTISAPDWKTYEKDVKTKRYERLSELIVDKKKRPYWIDETIKDKELYLLDASDKWKIINDALSNAKDKKTETPMPAEESTSTAPLK